MISVFYVIGNYSYALGELLFSSPSICPWHNKIVLFTLLFSYMIYLVTQIPAFISTVFVMVQPSVIQTYLKKT